MSNNFVSALLAVILLGISTATVAGPEEGRKSRGHFSDHGKMMGEFGNPERMLDHMTRWLELDEGQTQRIGNILGAAGPETEVLLGRGRAAREAIAALDAKDPDYDAKLQDLALESGEVATSMILLHGRVRSEVSAELTHEQTQMLAEKRHHMGERMGRRHHRRPEESGEAE